MRDGQGLLESEEALEELVRASQEGDGSARERLCVLARRIGTVRLRELGISRAQELEDLLQELVASVLEICTARGWRPERSLTGFLKWRALGVFSAWAGRRRQEAMHADRERALEDLAETAPSTSSAAERVDPDLAAALAACKQRLSAKAALILRLRYDGGLSNSAIADRLGMKTETVATGVHRANKDLRRCLADKGFQRWSA